MKILLDTQCWLWMVADPERLPRRARAIVGAEDHDLHLSSVSVWEIVIKHALGKLELPAPPREFVATRMQTTGVLPLAMTQAHALAVGELPDLHRDPFDRLLVAQARVEACKLLTADRQLRRYPVELVWAGLR